MKAFIASFKSIIVLLPVCIILLYPTVWGCSSSGPTKPNAPYVGPYPANYNHLASQNPLLAEEIGKLPEIQDGISNPEAHALEQLLDLYFEDTGRFDAAFNQMYLAGIPEIRRYCSPLQALFWMALDGKTLEAQSVIEDYSLDTLLKKAWGFGHPELKLTGDQISEIIDNITDNKKRYIYKLSRRYNNDEYVQELLALDYYDHKKIFNQRAREIIEENLVSNKAKHRWSDFSLVADRLNSPELIDYFIDYNFTYRLGDIPSPKVTFVRKYGNCIALAIFGEHILKKAGYTTFIRSVDWAGLPCCSDHTGSGIITNDNKYIIVVDFGIPNRRNIVSGPYDDIIDVDSQLSHGHQIIDRMWGHKHRITLRYR